VPALSSVLLRSPLRSCSLILAPLYRKSYPCVPAQLCTSIWAVVVTLRHSGAVSVEFLMGWAAIDGDSLFVVFRFVLYLVRIHWHPVTRSWGVGVLDARGQRGKEEWGLQRNHLDPNRVDVPFLILMDPTLLISECLLLFAGARVPDLLFAISYLSINKHEFGGYRVWIYPVPPHSTRRQLTFFPRVDD